MPHYVMGKSANVLPPAISARKEIADLGTQPNLGRVGLGLGTVRAAVVSATLRVSMSEFSWHPCGILRAVSGLILLEGSGAMLSQLSSCMGTKGWYQAETCSGTLRRRLGESQA